MLQLLANQVTLEAGFSHLSHLARCMRRILGTTPRQFQRHQAAQKKPGRKQPALGALRRIEIGTAAIERQHGSRTGIAGQRDELRHGGPLGELLDGGEGW